MRNMTGCLREIVTTFFSNHGKIWIRTDDRWKRKLISFGSLFLTGRKFQKVFFGQGNRNLIFT